MSHIWLASYPRSGNTLLRTILNSCFGFKSGTIYPNGPLSGNKVLQEYIGHLEQSDRSIRFPPGQPPLIKTHELDKDKGIKTIYVARNGLDSIKSLYDFYDRKVTLERIIRGEFRFGSWSDHIKSWSPWDRQNTLFLRYEELADEEARRLAVEKMADFLDAEIKSHHMPSREKIASADGKIVRGQNAEKPTLTEQQQQIFYEFNGDMMDTLGY
ncbi:MAG: sulfotransferase domain-containing protein [Boseongicola sp.]|nr:sulfotransferase domain-containing protein [Boseongicola sp.]